MKMIIIDLIVEKVKSEIGDRSIAGMEKIIEKGKLQSFLKSLKHILKEYCSKNPCMYLDSDAFSNFMINSCFIEKIVSRATSVSDGRTESQRISEFVREAKSVAKAENVVFSTQEERLIKDLYKIINEKVAEFYHNSLPQDLRIIEVKIEDSKNAVIESNNSLKGTLQNSSEILHSITSSLKLSGIDAEEVAKLLAEKITEGRFKEFEELEQAYGNRKDEDIKLFCKIIHEVFGAEIIGNIVSRIADIDNNRIREKLIRIIIPVLLYRGFAVAPLCDLTKDDKLKKIIAELSQEDYLSFFKDEVYMDHGIEAHRFSKNEKNAQEFPWLSYGIIAFYLNQKRYPIKEDVFEKIAGGNPSWFFRILLTEQRVDAYVGEHMLEEEHPALMQIENELRKEEDSFSGLCGKLRSQYYSARVKILLLNNRVNEAEEIIPIELRKSEPIRDLWLATRIENNSISLEELYSYSKQKEDYRLIIMYFNQHCDPQELIEFCRTHEDIFEKNWQLFFMFSSSLKLQEKNEERRTYLVKYKDVINHSFEYWNEMFDLEGTDTDMLEKEFIEACQGGEMKCFFPSSWSCLVEQLLDYRQMDLAQEYLDKFVKRHGESFQTRKTRARIEQGKGHDIEAIKWYKAAFDMNQNDPEVIEPLMVLSIRNNRSVDKGVMDAARRFNTSEFHMCLSAVYYEQGDVKEARNENIIAILSSQEGENKAFAQRLYYETVEKGFEKCFNQASVTGDTAVCCVSKTGRKRFICIYEERILPSSPYLWNGDYHIYKEDAAEFRYLRKKEHDTVIIEDEEYSIQEIISLEGYFVRIALEKMVKLGKAKTFIFQAEGGMLKSEEFTNWVSQNVKEDQESYDWIEQYNNIEDVPFPLFAYKRFTRFTYTQFVSLIFDSCVFFIRQYQPNGARATGKYVASFSTLLLLHKIGVPKEKIRDSGVFITKSTMNQIGSDSAKMIKEYESNKIYSLRVLDGKTTLFQENEEGKTYWLREAGSIRKFCDAMQTVDNDTDLSGLFFGTFDSKELLGICDYDAISFVLNNKEYSLLSIEAFHSYLADKDEIGLNVSPLTDWLIETEEDLTILLNYFARMMQAGCFMTINKNVLSYISSKVSKMESMEREAFYEQWEALLHSIDEYEGETKEIAVQYWADAISSFDSNELIEHGILCILFSRILEVKKLSVDLFVNEEGAISAKISKKTDKEKQE